jgi:hypothetical protein
MVLESAVSLGFFISFVEKLQDRPEITTEQVVAEVLRPATLQHQCRYVETLSGGGHAPTFFVCHRWAAKFHDTAAALLHHFRGADKEDTYLWLDIFAVRSIF